MSSATVWQRMAAEPEVTAELAREHGIPPHEYELLLGMLGRRPNYTELGIASALFSEHCSYKSSRVWLRRFPTTGERVVQGPGENAGVVDLGHGLVAAFKMESHNHPSFIEPYQGAATGVGGILRDIFTMGARPIACLDSLRFGALDAPRMRHLVDGVVRGVGDYGNCVGIPTVGGETGFHPGYNGNILVNAFALGICRREQIFRAGAHGPGNPILYAGSHTGRDGIHGATMASEAFDQQSENKRPTVQVGDPFTEKVLLEACLQAMASGALVGIQDMGAAGLTSSCFEMAARAGTGLELDLERVPLREPQLTPYELMLSESQERMVLVVERGKEAVVVPIFERFGLQVVPVGQVTAGGRAVLRYQGRVVADLPIAPLVDGAPRYQRPASPPAEQARLLEPPEVPAPGAAGLDPAGALLRLLATPELGDKSWIYRQYDSTVRGNTVVGPGADAAVLRLKGTPSALALTSDVNPVYCRLDPRSGGAQAVAEAARNLACVGALPVALTDCLNFGNPERPEIAWQLRECITGMAEACRALLVPVISGNVSLYNDTEGRSIHPTPTVAMVGTIDQLPADAPHRLGSSLRRAGERILLLGDGFTAHGGSAYLRLLFDLEQGRPPAVDPVREAALHRLLRAGWQRALFTAAHDLAEGGFLVALAEMTLERGLGAQVRLLEVSPAGLFAEDQARALVAVAAPAVDEVWALGERFGVPVRDLGEAGSDRLVVAFDGGRIEVAVSALREVWRRALPSALGM